MANKKDKLPFTARLLRLLFQKVGKVAPGLMARFMYRLWFSTTRVPAPKREQDVLKGSRPVSLVHNSLPIAVNLWGNEGPVILLVHGWNGRGTQLCAFVKPLLSAGYQVVSFDAPGHGKTPGNKSSIFEISDVILAVDKQFGPIHGVIAHSFGVLCIAMALNQNFRTDCAICISPPLDADGLVEKFVHALDIPESVEGKFRQLVEKRFGQDVWHVLSSNHLMKDLSPPALFIHDKDDRDVPWQEGEAAANAWPNAEFVLTNGLGHRRILRNADIIQQVVDFIKKTD